VNRKVQLKPLRYSTPAPTKAPPTSDSSDALSFSVAAALPAPAPANPVAATSAAPKGHPPPGGVLLEPSSQSPPVLEEALLVVSVLWFVGVQVCFYAGVCKICSTKRREQKYMFCDPRNV
jgi:hypothetical protein